MKNKFLKSIASVVAVVMLMSMVPAVVSADATISDVEVAISKTEDGKMVTVTATVSGLTEYTLLAVRDNAAYDDISDIPSDEVASDASMSPLEKQVEYIDQPTVSGTALSYTFPLRDREGDLAMTAADSYINVFLGGAGASAVVATAVEMKDGPAIEVEEPAEKYYVEDENVVVTYEFANDDDGEIEALWEAKTFDVKIGDETGDETLEDVVWDFAGNNLKIPAASFDEEAYEDAVITIAETDAEKATFYDATAAAVTFAVASRVDEAKAAVPTSLEQVPNTDDTAVEITIPANTNVAGVEIAYELVTTGYEINDNKITVTRPAEDDDPIEIEVKATLTYAELEIDPISIKTSVRPVGGVAIEPENVTILKASGAYGTADKALIKVVITDDGFDNTTTKLVIDGAELYYCVDEDAYYGVIASTYSDADAIVSAAEEATGETKTFYKGNAELSAARPKPGQPLMTDAYKAARTAVLFIGQPATAAAMDPFELITCDFDFNGQILMTDAYAIAGAAVAAIQG